MNVQLSDRVFRVGLSTKKIGEEEADWLRMAYGDSLYLLNLQYDKLAKKNGYTNANTIIRELLLFAFEPCKGINSYYDWINDNEY